MIFVDKVRFVWGIRDIPDVSFYRELRVDRRSPPS
jgi:hypothetical protein